jgi:uncharacterized repeat protein (TIGR01451 family)
MKSGFVRTRTRPVMALAAAMLLLGALLIVGAQPARAATTRTWLGTIGSNWSTAANWTPAAPPVNGDALIFPAVATNKTTTNDIPALDLASLQFAGGYSVTGLGFTVAAQIAANLGSGSNVSIAAPIVLDADVTVTVTQFHTLTLAGQPVALDLGSHTATFAGDGQSETTGDITGTGNILVAKGATLVLSAATTYSGATSVTGSTLALNGGSVSASSSVAVSAGGSFGGVGSAGPLSLAGSLLYPGIFGSITTGGISAPSLSLDAASTARFRLAGSAFPGSYDHVSVNGPVALGSAQLDLVWDFEPVVGEQFHLITGATSLTGTFAGLPEGAIFSSHGRRFSITYLGGAGHEVVVTRLPAAPADLSIALVPSPATVAPGGTVTLTITVTNHGPGDAPLVSVSNDLPAQLAFQSVNAAAGFSCATPAPDASGQVRCSGGTIAAGASATFTVTAKAAPTASGTVTTDAAVSSAADETASTDNSTSATITIGQPTARQYRVFAPNIARD